MKALLFLFLFTSAITGHGQTIIDTFLFGHSYKSIQIDADGILWICDDNGNLTSYNGAAFNTIEMHANTCRLLKDKEGKVYRISNGTTFDIAGNDIIEVNRRLSDPFITKKDVNLPLPGFDKTISTKTYLSNNKYILNSTDGELYIGENDQVKMYMIPDLPLLENINQIRENKGVLYIATNDTGLYIWNEPDYTLHHVDTYTGLVSNQIYDFTFDENGDCWVVTDMGVNVLRLAPMLRPAPPVMTDVKIQVAGQSSNLDKKLILSANHSPIQVRCLAIDLLRTDDIEYQWSLHPNNDAEWSGFLTEGDIIIDKLSTGEYNLQLRATADRKYYSFSPVFPISVRDNFWQSYWSWIFGGIAMLGIMWLGAFVYYNNSIDKLTKQRDKIVLENQLLQSRQQALQLQMNPHFLFNSLSAVQGLIALGENKKARKHLQSFAQLMRIMLDQSRSEKTTIKKEIQFLEYYLSLEQMARNDRFTFEVSSDGELDDEVYIPPMVIQPIVENAIIHGMKGLHRQGHIQITIEDAGDRVLCTVDDDGVGRRVDHNKSNHNSHGLHILTERINVHSRGKIDTPIEIIDKKEIEDSSTGTLVKIILPKL